MTFLPSFIARESDSYDPQFDEEMQALQRMKSAHREPIKKDVVRTTFN